MIRRIVIVLIPVVVGAALIAWGVQQLRIQRESARWHTVIGTVVDSSYQEEYDTGSDQANVRRVPRVIYEYEVEGQMYQGSRIAFGTPKPLSTDTDGVVQLNYFAGEQYMIFYDPANPSEAVLERPSVASAVVPIVIGVIIIFLTAGAIFGLRRNMPVETYVVLFALLPLTGCDAVQAIGTGAGGSDHIEVALFEGGYGIHWHQAMAEQYLKEHPEVTIDLWGDPRIEQKTKPRFLQGDPPDVLHNRMLPAWLLIGNGELRSFNEALDMPAPGSDKPWRDLFFPGTLAMYESDGQVWSIPSAFNAWACWYDAKQFREHGWEPPRTWAEFDELCAQIRADGVAPMAFQGKYPVYAWWTYISVIQRTGGLAAVNRINACEPGAFSHPDVVWAAQLMQDMAMNHFQPGAMAMNHTESQLQFVNNTAAMVYCGLWLDNEMKESTPPGFEMRAFTVPEVEGGKGNPRLVQGSGWEFFLVSAETPNPDRAFDFVRYMVSPENAASMGETIGVISPLKGATPREVVSPALGSAIDMIDETEGIFNIRVEYLLLDWRANVMNPEMAKLLKGESTAQEFCEAMDRGVAESLALRDRPLPPYTPYDPTEFGEEE